MSPSIQSSFQSSAGTREFSVFVPANLPDVMEVLPYGILILNSADHLLYANSKAQELCYALPNVYEPLPQVPQVIVDLCDRWAKPPAHPEPLVMECLGREQQRIRLRVQPLNPEHSTPHPSETCLLVFLENRDEQFQADLNIESQQYGLTDREAEIWTLLRQEYTYEEVAGILGLSLNTIKTHAKRIHSKRQVYQQTRPTVWVSR